MTEWRWLSHVRVLWSSKPTALSISWNPPPSHPGTPKLSFSDIVVNSEKETRLCSPRNEGTLFWRSYQETWPNEHFLGKPEQTKDLHLFWKSENICFPRHLNACGLDAKPHPLSSGRRVARQPSCVDWATEDREPSVHINHCSSTLSAGN